MDLKVLIKKPKFMAILLSMLIIGACSTNPYASSKNPHEENSFKLELGTVQDHLVFIDDFYLGLNLDSSQVFGGTWWEGSEVLEDGLGGTVVQPLDLENELLLHYATALSPSIIRIGGTEADTIFYDLSDNPRNRADLPPNYHLLLDIERLDAIKKFLEQIDAQLLFTINAGPGPRSIEKSQTNNRRNWNEENARTMIEAVHSRNIPLLAWEFGNEPNAYPFVYGLPWRINGQQYANDFDRFFELVKNINPDYKVVGPATAHWPLLGEGFSVAKDFFKYSQSPLDATTFHYYPQQSNRGNIRSRPAEPHTMLNEFHLDDILYTLSAFEAFHRINGIEAPIWLGETGNAQFGGQEGISNTFISSLWWIDLLSLAAHSGIQKVFRQTLVGSEYGLLDYRNFEALPDYWTTYLWKKLISGYPRSLSITAMTNPFYSDKHDLIRTYSFSNGSENSVIAINLDQQTNASFEILNEIASVQYILVTAPDPWGKEILFNGEKPSLVESVEDFPWNELESNPLVVPPLSFVLARL